MPRASPILTTFNAGELSPLLHGRPDLAKYHNGCTVLENMITYPHGPATRRPGTYYVAQVKDVSKKTRLVAFEFSTTQAYILEFGHQYIRFYKDLGQIQLSSAPYEITTTYQESQLFGLKFAQSADTLYIAHPSHPPRKLTRTGHTAWTLIDISFRPPATYEKDFSPTATLTPGAVTGTGVTFTASHAVFQAGDVDRQIAFGTARAIITDVAVSPTYLATVTCDIIDDFPDTDPIAIGAWALRGSPTGSLTPSAVGNKGGTITLTSDINSFRDVDPGKYTRINNGFVKIIEYVSITEVKCEVLKVLATADASAVWTLDSAAWSATNGYPAAVSFFEERLAFAGTATFPQTIWLSVIADYENHTPGVDADDALEITVSANQVNAIRWLEPSQTLLIGTVGGEWRLGSSDLNEPVTPTNLFVKRQTVHGCADMQPVTIGSATIFVQRAGRKLRQIVYSFETDSYTANDLTLLAEHITKKTITSLAYQEEPLGIVWAVRGDGQLLGLTYNPKEDVFGWSRVVTAGEFESVAVIPGAGEEYELWVVVKRTIKGATKRYVEYFKPLDWGDDQADCFFVDSGLTYAGDPTTTLTGLDHLEGESVAILADGATHPNKTVASGGSITLDRSAQKVHAGLGLTSKLVSMRLEAGSAEGTAQGKTKRIHKVIVRLFKSLGMKIGPSLDKLDTVPFRKAPDQTDAPPPLFTGDKTVSYPKGHETDAQVMIVQDTPLPLTVFCLVPRVRTSDGG